MINFVHIPKTAGTSFRLGAEDFFGANRIAYDYGKFAPETSKLIRDVVYTDFPDLFKLSKGLEASGISMISGHVMADKYVRMCGVSQTIAFVRDPVQRIASEYKHHVRVNGFQGDFQDFYRNKGRQNRQVKILGSMPLRSYGLVGITERYNDSLELINEIFDTKIPVLEKNKAFSAAGLEHELDPEIQDEICELNQDDIKFYQRCRRTFIERLEIKRKGHQYVHGITKSSSPKVVSGWCWHEMTDEPVWVSLLVNGDERMQVPAVSFVPALARFNAPRSAYVGFKFEGDFKEGDVVECRAVNTGQLIGDRVKF